MILTCPECSTSYHVDDARVPAAGRVVKCSSCGAKWTARREAAPPAELDPAPLPKADLPGPDEVIVEGPEAQPAEAEPLFPRRRPATPPPPPRAGAPVLLWVATAAITVGLVAGLLIFRAEIARVFPAVRGVYASVGVPAEPLGLVIEQVRADAAFQGGRPVLAVSGQIRNVRGKPADAPGLRVSLLDKAGKALAAKVAQPIDGRVPAGQVRHFSIAIVDPPADVHDLQVTFETPRKASAAGASVRPRAAEAVITGPQPVDARPLPPGSPDALPTHD